MNRSIRSMRRVCVLLIAVFAFAVIAPTGAFAQDIEPTDEQYGNGAVGFAGASGEPAADSSSGISSLPFTGLDVAAIAAIGAGLVGTGLLVRRAARTREDAL